MTAMTKPMTAAAPRMISHASLWKALDMATDVPAKETIGAMTQNNAKVVKKQQSKLHEAFELDQRLLMLSFKGIVQNYLCEVRTICSGSIWTGIVN